MNKDLIWKLFESTGKIEYYLLYKKLREEEYDRSIRGNSRK